MLWDIVFRFLPMPNQLKKLQHEWWAVTGLEVNSEVQMSILRQNKILMDKTFRSY
jgi:hypothetical protein